MCSVEVYEDKQEHDYPGKSILSSDASLRMSGIVNEHNIEICNLIHTAKIWKC
jgi:hypothetical protein